MASHFFNNTLSQVSSQVVQGGSLGEIRVGRRMVQIKGRLAEGKLMLDIFGNELVGTAPT